MWSCSLATDSAGSRERACHSFDSGHSKLNVAQATSPPAFDVFTVGLASPCMVVVHPKRDGSPT